MAKTARVATATRIERFAPGQAPHTIFVPPTNDVAPKPAQSFKVLLGTPCGATERLRVGIVDDD